MTPDESGSDIHIFSAEPCFRFDVEFKSKIIAVVNLMSPVKFGGAGIGDKCINVRISRKIKMFIEQIHASARAITSPTDDSAKRCFSWFSVEFQPPGHKSQSSSPASGNSGAITKKFHSSE